MSVPALSWEVACLMNGIDDVMIESRDGLNNIIMYKLIYGSTLIYFPLYQFCVL